VGFLADKCAETAANIMAKASMTRKGFRVVMIQVLQLIQAMLREAMSTPDIGEIMLMRLLY
jgi:hypothetical protein